MTHQRIWFKPYYRKDGSLMLFANNDRGVSIGINSFGLPAPWGKYSTQGKRNLADALEDHFAELEADGCVIDGTPDFDAHDEPKADLGGFGELYITDRAEVGGVSTGSDGVFLYHDDKLYHI